MSGLTLYCCFGPIGAHWQLGDAASASGTLALLGWSDDEHDPVESGVPDRVTGLLADGLLRLGRVSFLATTKDAKAWADQACLTPLKVSTRTAWRRWFGAKGAKGAKGAEAVWVTSSQAGTVRRLFQTDGFNWTLQSQIALVSEEAPKDLQADDVDGLLSEEWIVEVGRLSAQGVVGGLRPGVDGDVAGLLMLGAGSDASIADALREACLAHRATFVACDEAQFATAMAGGA